MEELWNPSTATALFIREICDGVLVSISIMLAVFMLIIVSHRMQKISWRYDLGGRLAMALFILGAGTAMRSTYSWFWLHCINLGNDCDWIEATTLPVWTIASLLSFIGGIWTIKILSPPRWALTWFTIACASLLLPLAYYGLARV